MTNKATSINSLATPQMRAFRLASTVFFVCYASTASGCGSSPTAPVMF